MSGVGELGNWILFKAEYLGTQTSLVRGESVGAGLFEFGESLMLGYRELASARTCGRLVYWQH